MTSRTRWLIVVAFLVGGCVRAGTGSGANPQATPLSAPGSTASLGLATSSPVAGGALTEVQLARAGSNVLVLTRQGLYKATGEQLDAVTPSLPAQSVSRAVAAEDSLHLVVAVAVDDSTVIEFRSADGGSTWAAAGRESIPTLNGIANVHIGIAGSRIVVLANEATNSNVSSAMIAASADDGATWTVAQSPTGGEISSAGGVFWLVGGVMGDKVLASADGVSWRPVTIPVASAYWTAGNPTTVDGIGVVVPITSHDPTAESQVTFWASTDQGITWRALGSVAAPHTEFNTTVPASVTSDGHWIAIWPDGSKILSGILGDIEGRAIASPNGLPNNVSAVVFSSATEGVADAAQGSCPNGKLSCISTTVVVHTRDGGQTWVPMH